MNRNHRLSSRNTPAVSSASRHPRPVAFADADLSIMAASFYADNKRVSNRKIREELGVRLRYPSYREGLEALAASSSPSSARPRSARS